MAPSPGRRPHPLASVQTKPSRKLRPPAQSPAPVPAPTPSDTHSPHSPPACVPAPGFVGRELRQEKSVPPQSPHHLLAHPAIQTVPSAPPLLPASAGKTVHALPCSLPAALAPPGSGTAAQPPTDQHGQADVLGSPLASLPMSYGPPLNDAATSSATSARSSSRKRYTPAATALAVHLSGAAADQNAHTTAQPHHRPLPPTPLLPFAVLPCATLLAPIPIALPIRPPSAIYRAD